MHNHKVTELVIEYVLIRPENRNNSNFRIWKEEKVLGRKAVSERTGDDVEREYL